MTSTSTDRRLGVNSGMAVKVPCRVATTAAITLSGEQTIDGVAVVTGDRVLVKDQSTTTYNGIWICDTGDWSRAVDADGLYDITDGTLVPVAHGTVGGGKVFQASGTNPITPGTTAVTFAVSAVFTDVDFNLGEVLMYATAPSSWVLLDENRVPIDISASTTDGLQETIDYAYANGLNIRVLGGMSTGVPEADYGIMYCSTQVAWPPMRGCTVDLLGVIIAFTAAVTGDGMVFDSMQEVDFRLVGEITYQGNGDAVVFAPHSALPVDTTIGIGASRIYIGAIACPGGSPDSCVHFDTTNGSIISGHYEFEELNGAAAVGSPPKADYGIKVSVPSSSYAFEFNTIRANAIHEVILAGVQAGLSTTHADNIAANSYLIGQIQTNGTDADGFNTFGDSDADVSIGLIQAIGGNLKRGVYLQSSAANNTISVGSILGATTAAVADLGTNNAVAYNGTYSWPVETRIAPTLAGTWTNLGTGQPDVTYWKDPFGVVHLEGAATNGGADTIFTLPTGYRPAAAQLFPAVANSVFSYIQIDTAGVVSCPAHTAVSLNGISFRT